MGLQKYESTIQHISAPQQTVYDKLADLRHLEELRRRLSDPAAAEQLKAGLPPDIKPEQIDRFCAYAEGMELGADYLTLNSPVGRVTLRLTEQEPPKCLKYTGEGGPLPLTLWIQLLPTVEGCKMRVTLGAEVSVFMKALVAKPLQKAADGLAEMLARLPYAAL